MPVIGYLFAGAPDGLVLHEESARALLPTPYAYVLHADGLAARVAAPGFAGLLPLASWAPGLVRDVQALAPNVASAATAAIARTAGPPPLPVGLTDHCYTVARDPRHPLKAAVGAYRSGMEPPAPYSYIVAANGVFVWSRTEAFEAFVPVAPYPEGTVWGLDALAPGARLLVPRVPAEILAYLIEEARREATQTGNESLWQLCWREGRWVIVEPEQTRARGSVGYDPNPALEDGVVKVHSHGRFGTFWSRTDNRDERHAEFNIIVGDLRAREGPSALCRVGVYGRTLAVPLAAVVEGDLPVRDRYGDTPPGTDARGAPLDTGADAPRNADAGVNGDAGDAVTDAVTNVVASVVADVFARIGEECARIAGRGAGDARD